jgi:hypothetical protein
MIFPSSAAMTGTDALHENADRGLSRPQRLLACGVGAALGLGVAVAMLALVMLASEHL